MNAEGPAEGPAFVDTNVFVYAYAARHLGASTLYSEDLNAGQRIGGVEVVNPFSCS